MAYTSYYCFFFIHCNIYNWKKTDKNEIHKLTPHFSFPYKTQHNNSSQENWASFFPHIKKKRKKKNVNILPLKYFSFIHQNKYSVLCSDP